MDNGSAKSRLKSFRMAAGVSQANLAAKVGISRTAMRNLEKPGMTAIINENFLSVCQALGIKPESVLSDSAADNELREQKLNYGRIRELETSKAELERRIEEQNNLIDELRDHLDDKTEIIKHLKGNHSGDQND